VYLTVDGYERAFLFNATFPPSGTPTFPTLITNVGMRLDAPRYANPEVPYHVGVEVDNARPDYWPRLDILTRVVNEDDKLETQARELAEFRGDRRLRMLFAPGGPEGGLLFQPEMQDWGTDLDLSAVHGRTTLRLRMLDRAGKEVRFRNNEASRPAGAEDLVTEIQKDVMLDSTPPENMRFVDLPEKAVRGKAQLVTATAEDPESGIRGAVFFLGKSLPGGKIPEGALQAVGRPFVPTPNLWAAELQVARDQRAPLDVSVQFTNGAGLTRTVTATLDVIDPPPEPPAAALKASIAGTVVEGDRPQVGLPVELRDGTGRVILATGKTGEGGTFLFKDLNPGLYRVVSMKTASNTQGMTPRAALPPIDLKAGEQLKGVEIKLYR
jgi:hypothetical protein